MGNVSEGKKVGLVEKGISLYEWNEHKTQKDEDTQIEKWGCWGRDALKNVVAR